MRSASLFMSRERSKPVTLSPHVVLKAFLAAATATSISFSDATKSVHWLISLILKQDYRTCNNFSDDFFRCRINNSRVNNLVRTIFRQYPEEIHTWEVPANRPMAQTCCRWINRWVPLSYGRWVLGWIQSMPFWNSRGSYRRIRWVGWS